MRLALALLAAMAGSAAAEPVSLSTATGTLAGTLTRAGNTGPGVLIIAGSGPTDRDGNQPGMRNDSLRLLAEGLAGCGIGSVRTDKRGIAASHDAAPDEEQIDFDTYVLDAVRWLDWLRAQPGIDGISVVGHSEGALVATRAAARTQVQRLVLLEGAGRKAGDVLRDQLASRLVSSPALLQRADHTIDRLEHGETVEFPPPALGALFRGSVQPYLISWFRLDPAAELAALHMPALVVQGTADFQVAQADAERLRAARPGVELALFQGMNHVLRLAPAGFEANVATYARPDLPLAPGLVSRVCAFLHGG